MKKTFWMMTLLLLMGGVAFAQADLGAGKAKKSDLSAKVPVDKKVCIGHLDNGFTYYIRANKKPENRVQFRLVSNAGSILEREDQRGLAHFCEHMAFNGIKGYPHNTMIQTLQEHGIEFGREINAYTSFDETVYYVNVPSDDPEMMKMGIDILDGWAGNILFDQQEIESERGVIHEEWRGGVGHGDRMRQITWPIMLKGSLYADRLPIGLESVIMNFERQSIVDFFNDWYRPDLQAIVIVGDIEGFEYAGKKGVKAMEQRVKDVFSTHPAAKNPMPRPSFSIPSNVEPLIAVATDKENTSTSLQMMWKHKKASNGTVGDYRQQLVRNLVDMMINDRLGELSQQASSPFLYAYAGYGGFLGRELDCFTVATAPKENRIEEAMQLLLTEMKRIDDHGFLQVELDRQKEEMLANYTKSAKEADKTPNNSHADEYTRNFLEGEVIPGIRQEWRYAKEFVPEITLEECNEVVKTWITDENMIVVLTAPEKKGVKVPNQKAIKKVIKKAKKAKTTQWVDNFKDEPLFDKELASVTPTVSKQNAALDYTEYTLPNGIRFIVKKTDYKADEIIFRSFSMGGTSLYSDAEAYQAQNAANFIDAAGIAQFNASQLQKKLKGKNLSISPSISGYTQGFSGSCSPQDLETTLQLLNLYYTAPRKDKETYDRLIESTKSQIKYILENPQTVFIDTYYKTAYPNDKRSVVIPTMEKINELNLDRMYEIFRERFADASDQVFFFVGNIDDAAVATIAKYLNNLPCNGKQKGEKWINREAQFASGVQHAEAVKGIERQGMIIMNGKSQGFDATPQNRIVVQELGEALQIRTTEYIREELGLAYSPSASVDFDIMPNKEVEWMFYISCAPGDTAKRVEQACIELIKQMCEQGPDESTLNKVKEQMIVNRGNSRQSNGFWLGQIYGSYFYGESRDHVNDYEQMVRSVSAADVKAIRGNDGSLIELDYDSQHRPTSLRMTTGADAAVRTLTLAYNDRDSIITVTDNMKVLTAVFDKDYQPQRLVGGGDTIGYYSQYYSNGIPVSANSAFNLEHHTLGGQNSYYAFLLGGQSLQPDSLHCADSLRIVTVTGETETLTKLKLTYSRADNRCQSVDVNQLILGTRQCDPYQLLSLFRYARQTSIVSEAEISAGNGYVVDVSLNADRSVAAMTVKQKTGGVVQNDAPLEYTFEY